MVVVANNGIADPYFIINKYKERMEHHNLTLAEKSECCFFPKMVKDIQGENVEVIDNVPVDYNGIRRNLLDLFKCCGVDVSNLGVHSMRIGGATEFMRRGAREDTVTNHGRWKQASSRLRYG